MKATWNGSVLAESKETIVVEGNHYFPKNSIIQKCFKVSNTHTICHWKGTASYYSIEANGKVNEDAAWYYPETSMLANNIKGYIAFWKGVEVSNS